MLTIEQRLTLAFAHQQAGRLSEAQTGYRDLLREAPGLPPALYLLGLLAQQAGRHREAIDLIRKALDAHGPHPVIHSKLAESYLALGQVNEGIYHCREAVRLAPGNAQLHNQVGLALFASGHAKEAVEHLQEAVRLRPTSPDALNNLGAALRELEQPDAAIQYFTQSLRLEPTSLVARHNLGHTLESQGRIGEAIAQFEEALRHAANDTMTLASLGRMVADGFYRFADEQVRHIQQLAARPDLPPGDQLRLHQVLAWIFDRSGDYEQAFAHCRRARDLRKEYDRQRGIGFDYAAHHRFIDRIIHVFSPAWFERARAFGSDSELPIFIVGMMRSGTTLAEHVLASHPQVHGAGELPDMERLLKAMPRMLGTSDEFPECAFRLDAPTAAALAEDYLGRLQYLGGQAVRVVDKMPFNYLRLGLLTALFPRARIIHCRRNPLDTCLSCYFQDLSGIHSFTLDLADLGHYYREYERLMAHWRAVSPVRVFNLDYEALTADLEGVSRRLVDFCGLPWDERCLHFHENQRIVRTSSALQVRQPVYRSSVGKWKHYEAYIQPLIEALSPYEPEA
jgi:tetratricopeptide (TPR) repeat protein